MRHALAFALALVACTQAQPPAKPSVRAEPPVAASSASVAVAPTPLPAPATVPELTPEPFRVDDKPLKHVFAIEGATIVTTDNVVGYIDGERVEWIAKVPKDRPHIGHNLIDYVGGKYLDRIDVIMSTDNGRALSPIWLPLTGKGTLHDEAAGGGYGRIVEARIGDSVLIATHSSFNNDRITTVRGPNLVRKFANVKPCTGSMFKEPWVQASIDEHALVAPIGFQGTTKGTLVAIGDRCAEDAAFAEVWAPGSTTSRLVDLSAFWKRVNYRAMILRGSGEDELWLYNGEYQRLVQFENGELKAVAGPDAPVGNLFTSSKGQLHVRAADEILRRDEKGNWEVVARIAGPVSRLSELVMDDAGRFWGASGQEVYRLRETSRVPLERPCNSWFVRMGDQDTARTKQQSAELTKILASFPKNEGAKLLVAKTYPWVIGASFATKADAEAFVSHAGAALPKERLSAYCSDASQMDAYPNPR